MRQFSNGTGNINPDGDDDINIRFDAPCKRDSKKCGGEKAKICRIKDVSSLKSDAMLGKYRQDRKNSKDKPWLVIIQNTGNDKSGNHSTFWNKLLAQ